MVNLPFYWLAWRSMGKHFTLKTMVAVALLSSLSELLPMWLAIGRVNPLFAALAGGLLAGAGFLILFRHRASLGGFNVLVLWLQDRFGWRAGYAQLALDLCILMDSTPRGGPVAARPVGAGSCGDERGTGGEPPAGSVRGVLSGRA